MNEPVEPPPSLLPLITLININEIIYMTAKCMLFMSKVSMLAVVERKGGEGH